jgi:hypothetical protein
MGANAAIPAKRQRRLPMPLSWNEIRARALVFSREWADESSEDAEGKSFWDGFFNVFGITRRRVASFEKKVKRIDGKDGYIDLLWKGVLLVEQKSRGKDLDRAYAQATDYFPGLFGEMRQPETPYILVPRHSSERRAFIPIGFISPDVIVGDSNLCIADATPYHFGVLTSLMHMAWVRHVCGRLKSDYRYSNSLVYNNFPWPEPTEAQRKAIEVAAQGVLDARTKFPGSTLADLYDPFATPPELARAHAALDRAVDKAYGRTAFASEMERVAFLFDRYEVLTRPLLPPPRPTRKGRITRRPRSSG